MAIDQFSKLLRDRIVANNIATQEKPLNWEIPDNILDDVDADNKLTALQNDILSVASLKFNQDITADYTYNSPSNANVKVYAEDLTSNLSVLLNVIDKHTSKLKSSAPRSDLLVLQNNLSTLKNEILNTNTKLGNILTNSLTEVKAEDLVSTISSSNSIFVDLQNDLISALLGRQVESRRSKATNIKIGSVTSGIANELNNLTNTISSILTRPKASIRDLQGRFFGLQSLLDAINVDLPQTIKDNMGEGNRADILNYRTGRFSNSVKVDKLVLNKDSSIQAFYSWMKYPYQTFAPGFRQEMPLSRDPNILISKSIREIAATIVTNNLKTESL